MARFNRGFNNIKVKLIDAPKSIVDKAAEFNEWGVENFEIPYNNEKYFLDRFEKGKTFPKYIMEGMRLSFCIEGISRICLAQLTRDNAIFCSESHGLRPLSMEFNLPTCLYDDKSIMAKLENAQYLLEEAYIEACEKELPYPETRYLGLHAQTISVNASYTFSSFVRACHSRTNNSFCDELNLVYRKMYNEIKNYAKDLSDIDYAIMSKIFAERNCIDDSYYERTAVYNGDFTCEENKVEGPAHNDWRKSGWKKELEELIKTNPELFTDYEKRKISIKYAKDDLPTTYDGDHPRVAKNAIKNMSYYKEHKNDRL